MNSVIKKVPVPVCGVMLGTAALGNLLQSYGEGIRSVCGVFAAFLLVLFLLKLFLFPGMILEDMKNPIMASVMGTFSMALMILSTYIKPLIGGAAYGIWLFAVLLHCVLIVYFTKAFLLKPVMPKVFASYYIVYVGIATASVTAPAYGATGIGTACFGFGFVTFILLFALVTYRYMNFKEIPKPAVNLICIYAAPMSLCLAGYIQSVTPKSAAFILGMLAVSTVLYLFALYKLVTFLKNPFFPSMAVFTFPFVISAIAAKQSMMCLAKLESPMPVLKPVVLAETVLAVILVAYTWIRYMMFLFGETKKA